MAKGNHWKTRFKCKDTHGVWHDVGLSLDGTHVLRCTGELPVYMPRGERDVTPTTCFFCLGKS